MSNLPDLGGRICLMTGTSARAAKALQKAAHEIGTGQERDASISLRH